MRTSILCLLCVALCGAAPADQCRVEGTVSSADGLPLPGVTVYLRGSDALAVTDARGHFSVSVSKREKDELVGTLSGFRAVERSLELSGDVVRVDLTLQQMVAADIVVKSRREPVAGIGASSTDLTPLQIVRTAGSMADVFRALQMLPGVERVDEGAGLFVRGGDVSETRTFRDDAPIAHPYRFETPAGGFFGSVDPFSIAGLTFSTGAFPARYGNALSGVLDLQGTGRPTVGETDFTVGLAGLSTALAIPLGETGGLRLAANRGTPQILFRVNPPQQQFQRYPSSTNGSLSGYFLSPRYGDLRLFAYANEDAIGVTHEVEAFRGALDSSTRSALMNGRWQKDLAPGILATGSVAYDRERRHFRTGIVDLTFGDSTSSGRFDLVAMTKIGSIRGGVDVERPTVTLIGTDSVRGGDFGGVDGSRRWQLSRRDQRQGAYTELESSLGKLAANVGIRYDRFLQANRASVDPRIAVRFDLPGGGRLRAGWGVYHQGLNPMYLDREWGNPTLRPMRAEHRVIGYERGEQNDSLFLRVEAYDKTYRNLPLEDAVTRFSDRGNGTARGLDAFVTFAAHGWDGWMGYSFLSARRLFTPMTDVGRYSIPAKPFRPDFDIPQSVQWIVNRMITPAVSAGMSARYATGKPFTPVVAAEKKSGGWLPVYGPINSARTPSYARLDLNISRMKPLGDRGRVILYAGVGNALGRRNIFQYVYSEDFSERRPADGSWGRTFFVGTTIQLFQRQGGNTQ